MKRIVTLSVAAAIALSVGGLAGRATAQSPARAPSLAVTLGFIRDKIAEQGRLAYASTTRDSANGQTWDNQFTVEASNAARDDGDCSVGFHWRSTVDGKPAQDLDVHIPFKIVTSVSISSMDDDVARLNAGGGHSGWVTQIRPPIWVLLLHRSDGHTNTVDFADRDMAERVAKAMRHAADLCGGAASLPF